jgi:hypothetical protein
VDRCGNQRADLLGTHRRHSLLQIGHRSGASCSVGATWKRLARGEHAGIADLEVGGQISPGGSETALYRSSISKYDQATPQCVACLAHRGTDDLGSNPRRVA